MKRKEMYQYNLSEFQQEFVDNLFPLLIKSGIDKKIKHGISTDNEFIIYRRNNKGLISIIVNKKDWIIYSFWANEGDIRTEKMLDYTIDYEELNDILND